MARSIGFNDVIYDGDFAHVLCYDGLHGKETRFVTTHAIGQKLEAWAKTRTLIQDAVPELPAELREQCISGIAPADWDEMFKDDEDD